MKLVRGQLAKFRILDVSGHCVAPSAFTTARLPSIKSKCTALFQYVMEITDRSRVYGPNPADTYAFGAVHESGIFRRSGDGELFARDRFVLRRG